jgi:hypothetical protein
MEDRDHLKSAFESRLPGLDRGAVFADCLVDWNVPAIRNHSPDVSVFEEVRVPHDPLKGTFRLAVSGGCLLVVEVVSPDTRTTMWRRSCEYHAVGVPLYIIIDREHEDAPDVARLRPDRRVRLVAAERAGRVELPRLGLCLGLENDRPVCYDTVTGEKLGRCTEVLDAVKKAERKVREEGEARQKAEQKARKEADASKKAREKAREEADAARGESVKNARGQPRRNGQRPTAGKAEEKARQEAEARKKAGGTRKPRPAEGRGESARR